MPNANHNASNYFPLPTEPASASTADEALEELFGESPEVEELIDFAGLRTNRGRPEKPIVYELVKEIEPVDLESLSARIPTAPDKDVIKRLRETHMCIARHIAAGRKDWEIAAITGYSPARLSVLKTSPMMQELVARFREKIDAAFVDAQERLANIGLDAMQILSERMEETPEKVKTRELMEIIQLTADRTFAPSKGPKPGQAGAAGPVAVTVNFVTPNHQEGQIIDVSVEEGQILKES